MDISGLLYDSLISGAGCKIKNEHDGRCCSCSNSIYHFFVACCEKNSLYITVNLFSGFSGV